MRAILLFEEHMNLRALGFNVAEAGTLPYSRHEVLPGILSQHSYSRETASQVVEDSISFTPFVV
jgi:hypothetical protein